MKHNGKKVFVIESLENERVQNKSYIGFEISICEHLWKLSTFGDNGKVCKRCTKCPMIKFVRT